MSHNGIVTGKHGHWHRCARAPRRQGGRDAPMPLRHSRGRRARASACAVQGQSARCRRLRWRWRRRREQQNQRTCVRTCVRACMRRAVFACSVRIAPKPRRAAAPRSARAAPRPNAHLPERGVALRPCPSDSASTSRRRADPASLSLAQPWRRGAAGGELRRRHAAMARMPVGSPGLGMQPCACNAQAGWARRPRPRGKRALARARARVHMVRA